MNLRELEYLVALAKHKHFGRAAKEVFATQPTLSIQIKKLEQELGVSLLERTNRRVMMTPIGEKIAAHARAVLRGAEEIKTLAQESRNPHAGELHIGLFPTLAPYLLPRIVPGIMKAYPKLRLILLEEKTEVLIEKLKEGRIDAAFLALPVLEEGLEHLFVFEEEFLLAVASKNSWAGRRQVTRTLLKGKDLLLLEEGHCLRDQALEFCSAIGMGEFPDFRASSLETLRQMVAADVGMTLIPKMAAAKGGAVSYVPFQSPKPSRKIGLFWRKTSVRKKLLKDLYETVSRILPKNI